MHLLFQPHKKPPLLLLLLLLLLQLYFIVGENLVPSWHAMLWTGQHRKWGNIKMESNNYKGCEVLDLTCCRHLHLIQLQLAQFNTAGVYLVPYWVALLWTYQF
ncbi:hypothetical protein BDQ17DRAFT_1331777 [Cyathus striatus]|nr:hypothetical protein BDQ17DRAFT_1331777 [Cyathus striatus]